MYYKTLFILLCLAFNRTGNCQVPLNNDFARITQLNGLSHDKVSGIVQDSLGYIWISTAKGLNRYDGKNFLKFYSDTSANSLPQDDIKQCRLLKNNIIAASTNSGLFCINTITLRSFSLVIPAGPLKHQYKVNTIMDFTDDEEGNVYLLTRSGFYAFNRNQKLWFRYDAYTPAEVDKIVFAFGYSLVPAGKEKILLSTKDGILEFLPKHKKIRPYKPSNLDEPDITGRGTVRINFKNKDEFLFMDDSSGTFSLINIHSGKTLETGNIISRKNFNWRSSAFKLNDSIYAITQAGPGFNIIVKKGNVLVFKAETQFENIRCNALLSDRQGRLWIGTDNGIFYQKSNNGFIEKINTGHPGKNAPPVYRMVTTTRNKIFASSNNDGIHIFSKVSPSLTRKIDFRDISISARQSYSCIKLNEDTILAGNSSGLFFLNAKSNDYRMVSLPLWDTTLWITGIFRDSKGNIYVGKNEEGYFYTRIKPAPDFTLENHSNEKNYKVLLVRHFSEDREGNVWFGGHGLSRYNIKERKFDRRIDSFPSLRISRKEITSLAIDKHGNMYFGVAENGLMIYDHSAGSFKQLTRNDGLPDNNILALYMLRDDLWIGTESAISRMNLKDGKIETFDMNGAFIEDPFTGFALHFDSAENLLYAPLNNSILRFNPDKLFQKKKPPSFFVSDVQVNNKSVLYQPGSIRLPYNRNNLVVNLAGINYDDAWQHQYYYRLTSDDKLSAWQFAGEQTSFNFVNLQPGEHNLEFMLRSKNNNWPPQMARLSILITPPFWKSPWFIITISLVAAAGFFLVYRHRIKTIKRNAGLDKHLAELEIKGLHAQMNPHFIFNALNSIKEMILMDEKSNASRYLSKFAQLIRLSLEQSRQTFITVSQCIQHLEQYLEMEKVRFENFDYRIDIDKRININETRIAPMLLQPLVENAIWHGLKGIRNEKLLFVRIYPDSKQLVCEVEDNGPGLTTENHNTNHVSIGISNIQERLALLNKKYNMNCSLTITNKNGVDNQSQGTIAILRLTV